MRPGQRLRAWRRSQRLSQAALAAEVGCSQPYIAQIESAARRPTLALAVALERLTAGWSEGPITHVEWLHSEAPSR